MIDNRSPGKDHTTNIASSQVKLTKRTSGIALETYNLTER